jgi:anti-anti-sigma factor
MELHNLTNNTAFITTNSKINGENENNLNTVIAGALKQGVKNIVLDFRPLDHMNSAGASTLVKLAVSAKKHQFRLFAFGLNHSYQEIFKLTGLSESIPFLEENPGEFSLLTEPEILKLKEITSLQGRQDNSGWAPATSRLQVSEKPAGAINQNVDGRRVIGPLQGFGPMWQKTYLLPIEKQGLNPHEMIVTMKQHFSEFQPSYNTFYPSSKGIAPGEIVAIDSLTPGGIVSTGVLVSYADDTSFTLMTPQGHPEAGWVTFSAKKQGDDLEMQIQGLARAADPFYELAFRVAGSKLQETIWKHVLSLFASYIGVEPDVSVTKTCITPGIQWRKTGNIWYNAQIRSLPYNISRLFRKSKRKTL